MNNNLSLTGTRMRLADLRPPGTERGTAADAEHNAAMAIRLLHEALLIAGAVAARCERQYCAALRNHSPGLAALALEHANAASEQAESLSTRVAVLGGAPAAPDSAGAARAPAEPRPSQSLAAQIGGYLVAEHATIESYRQIATLMEPCDRATQMLLDGIVAGEEERASRLAALLEQTAASPL
jgi:bacterioferritin (cytochrome b1)